MKLEVRGKERRGEAVRRGEGGEERKGKARR